jgi:hypothetical protein
MPSFGAFEDEPAPQVAKAGLTSSRPVKEEKAGVHAEPRKPKVLIVDAENFG